MEFLLATYALTQRLLLLPYASYKKRNYAIRHQLLHSITHRPTRTLSSTLPAIPTAVSLPLENGLIYLSAIVGRDENGTFSSDFASQLHFVLKNLQSTLEQARSCPDHMIKATVYLKDESNTAVFLQRYDELFTQNTPFSGTYNYIPVTDLDANHSSTIEAGANQDDGRGNNPQSTTNTTTPTTTPLNDPNESDHGYPRFQNLPRPALSVIIVESFFNQSCQIQIDGIACTKILTDPTIGIDCDSEKSPLFLDEKEELKIYREYIMNKWEHIYNASTLDEIDFKDQDQHPAIFHARLQIRLELEKVQRIEMDQKAMLRHVTSSNAGIIKNYPSAHAVTHIPTGYTFISGVIGNIPIPRGEQAVETDDKSDGNDDVLSSTGSRRAGDSDGKAGRGGKPPKELLTKNRDDKLNQQHQNPNKTITHERVATDRAGIGTNGYSATTTITSLNSTDPIGHKAPYHKFPPIPSSSPISTQNTTHPPTTNSTKSNITINHTADLINETNTPTNPAPLMPDSPFSLNFDPFSQTSTSSSLYQPATDITPLPPRPIEQPLLARPESTDVSLIKMIFKDKIHHEVGQFFKNWLPHDKILEFHVLNLLNLQIIEDGDIFDQLQQLVAVSSGGSNNEKVTQNSNLSQDVTTDDDNSNPTGKDTNSDNCDADPFVDDYTSLIAEQATPNNSTRTTTTTITTTTNPTTLSPTSHHHPHRPTLQPLPLKATTSINEIDPQLWLLRYQTILHEFSHVFAQTRQAIFNLITIAISSNVHLYTGITKVTIYTTSIRYLPFIKYAFQLYWPHHPLNSSPTNLFALSILPVTALPHDALVQLDVQCVQHDFNKPFLFDHIFKQPPSYYSGLNSVLWHTIFYLIYPDQTPAALATSTTPLYLNPIISKLAKGEFETKKQNEETMKRQYTEFAQQQRSEYYYATLLRQAQTLEVVTHDRVYIPYYNNPLIIFDKIVEKKQMSNPHYQEAERLRVEALKSTAPSQFDPFLDDNLQAGALDVDHVQALINKREMKLSLTELQYKQQTSSAQAITCTVVPVTYDQRLRFTHLTQGMYPRCITAQPRLANPLSTQHLHVSWFQTLLSPLTKYFLLNPDEVAENRQVANGFKTDVANISALPLGQSVEINTVSNRVHKTHSTLGWLYTDPDEKWYNYKYDGQYYKAQTRFFDGQGLQDLLLRQYQQERHAIAQILAKMNENELELRPTPQPQTDGDRTSDLLGLGFGETNPEEPNGTMKQEEEEDSQNKTKPTPLRPSKSSKSSRSAPPSKPSSFSSRTASHANKKEPLYDNDSDSDSDDTHLQPDITESEIITHSALYSDQYGFPCAPFVAVAIEDKLKYCLKYGAHITSSPLNGIVYGRLGMTPGTIYSSAFLGDNYLHLYGSIFKLLRLLKEECTLVKITFVVATNNSKSAAKTPSNATSILNALKLENPHETIIGGNGNIKPRSRLSTAVGNDAATNQYILGLVYRWKQQQLIMSNNGNLLLTQPQAQSSFQYNTTNNPTTANMPSTTSSQQQSSKAAPKRPIPRFNRECLQFLRYFQLYLGATLLYDVTPKFHDPTRMFGDFKSGQRPVITTFCVDELPNGAKYHIEVVGIYK